MKTWCSKSFGERTGTKTGLKGVREKPFWRICTIPPQKIHILKLNITQLKRKSEPIQLVGGTKKNNSFTPKSTPGLETSHLHGSPIVFGFNFSRLYFFLLGGFRSRPVLLGLRSRWGFRRQPAMRRKRGVSRGGWWLKIKSENTWPKMLK